MKNKNKLPNYNEKLLDEAINRLKNNQVGDITIDLSNCSDSTQLPLDLTTMNTITGIDLTTTYDSGYNFNIDNDIIWSVSDQQSLHVQGDANFDGDIKLKGESLSDMISAINDRLAILKPNPELEERWEKLKELRKQYSELEQELLEKEKMWEMLKG